MLRARVVVASPDATHAEYTLAAIAAGKPVLCEKPIAATAADGLRIVGAETALGRRLVQVGYMRRFDAAYGEMRRARRNGSIGAPVVLHNVHRNLAAPDWFTGAMAVTNSFVHEIDISRWLLGSEMVAAQVFPAGDAGLLMIVMRTDKGEIVSTEVNVNGGYGYHVHAQLVGTKGTIEMAAPARTLTNHAGAQGFSFPPEVEPQKAGWRRRSGAICCEPGTERASAGDGLRRDRALRLPRPRTAGSLSFVVPDPRRPRRPARAKHSARHNGSAYFTDDKSITCSSPQRRPDRSPW